MLIGNQYADNKVYRGIKFYDSMPLTSGDLLEMSDTNFMKNAYIMNNLLGYGTMNTPRISISSEGVRLSDPSVIMLDGDISLIQSDENVPLVSKDTVVSSGYSDGVVCILGWYQNITYNDKLRNYGGVNNSVLENDLLNEKFNVQISTRYQFRWFPVILSKEQAFSDNVSITINDRDRYGDLLNTTTDLTTSGKVNSVFMINKPTIMDYSVSDLYLIPIIGYTYSSERDQITNAYAWDKLKAGSPFIKGTEEPSGYVSDGTVWYNPDTREFKTYVEGSGFVDSASNMAFLQYQSVYTVTDEIEEPQDIVIPVNINTLEEGDILRVLYEGLELTVNEHYTINYENQTITLLEFTTKVDDRITFTSTKIVEASDITNVTTTFIKHMDTTGNFTVEGHVKLSDTLSSSDETMGVAATPKMVNDTKVDIQKTTTSEINTLRKSVEDTIKANANIVKDNVTNVSYRLGVENGLLYVEEV